MKIVFANRLWLLVLLFGAVSCKTLGRGGDDGKIEIVFLQVNDVYEIAPLSAGTEGGIARIGTLKKEQAAKNPNTILVMAGDFLSPSVYNTLQYEGKPVRGRQMVESLNAAGLDLAIFGNHEFDIRENELKDRINESAFTWFSSNTLNRSGNNIRPFMQNGKPLPAVQMMNVRDADGTTARLGLISVTLPFNMAPYVHYKDPLATAREMYELVKDSVDAVIAITHQAIEDDIILARQLPGLVLIIGGHEHDNRFVKEGGVFITKAHANAKSAYINTVRINKRKGSREVVPSLVYLDEKIKPDPSVTQVVEKWQAIAEKSFSALGFDARRVILPAYGGEALDGRETEVRRRPTGLTKLIVRSIEAAVPEADVAIMNGGSIRVDDVLHAPLTEYDVLRTLPFGGGIREVDMKGSLLVQVLEQGLKNTGNGGYLQVSDHARKENGAWLLKGSRIEVNKVYRVALTEFLFTGKEANLEYLHPGNPAIVRQYNTTSGARNDIRLALIQYIQNAFAAPK